MPHSLFTDGDLIAHAHQARLDDLGTQPAAMNQPGTRRLAAGLLHVTAGLAQPDASEARLPHAELLADQVIERHAPRGEVPPALGAGQVDVVVPAERFE